MVFSWSDWRTFFHQLLDYELWRVGFTKEELEDKADLLLAYVRTYPVAGRAIERVVFDMWTTPQYQGDLTISERVRKLFSVQWNLEHGDLVDCGIVLALADFLAKPPAFGRLVGMAGELALVSFNVGSVT